MPQLQGPRSAHGTADGRERTIPRRLLCGMLLAKIHGGGPSTLKSSNSGCTGIKSANSQQQTADRSSPLSFPARVLYSTVPFRDLDSLPKVDLPPACRFEEAVKTLRRSHYLLTPKSAALCTRRVPPTILNMDSHLQAHGRHSHQEQAK